MSTSSSSQQHVQPTEGSRLLVPPGSAVSIDIAPTTGPRRIFETWESHLRSKSLVTTAVLVIIGFLYNKKVLIISGALIALTATTLHFALALSAMYSREVWGALTSPTRWLQTLQELYPTFEFTLSNIPAFLFGVLLYSQRDLTLRKE